MKNENKGSVALSDLVTGWAKVEPTPDLRFVRRQGKLILEQRWIITTQGSQASEWKPVSVEDE